MKRSLYFKMIVSFLLIFCMPSILMADSEFFVPEYTQEYQEWQAMSKEEKQEFIEPQMYEEPEDETQLQPFSAESNMVGINLPAKFRRSDYDEVRKQDGNLCWACAATTMFEVNYGLTNYRKKRFSDVHMDYRTSKTYNQDGFNRNYNDGGNVNIAIAYATNGMGIVENANITSDNFKNAKPIAKVSDYEILSNATDIKSYLYEQGVLSAYTYMESRYFSGAVWNNDDLAYYCSDVNQPANHAITIVGWDDNYTNIAFPGQKGAYVVLNSYGTEFGNKGLYYIFYSDTFMKNNSFYAVTKTENINYDHLYQYDEFGQTATMGWSILNGGTYTANVFERKTYQPETLSELGIYFPTAQNLTIYINANGDDKNIKNATYVFSTGTKTKGYHTIKLPKAVTLNQDKFTVAVKYNGYMGVELASTDKSSWWYTVSSNYGESYISQNGINWRDLKTASELKGRAASSCIKAFTKIIEADYSAEVSNYAFNARYYAEHNLDLYQAFGYNESALKNHWETCGIAEGRASSCIYNGKYYVENNKDLQLAFGNNYVAAYQHFITNGCKEMRKSSLEYDGNYYKKQNGDLQKMSSMELLRHYIFYGKAETRQANDSFDIVNGLFDAFVYASVNPDLMDAFGMNEALLKNHWLKHGIAEGRIASLVFDAKYYAEKNADIKKAFGNNYTALYQHYVNNGFSEQRQASQLFAIKYYTQNNGDVKAVFGTNNLKILYHFISAGTKEGRHASSDFNVSAYCLKNDDLYHAFGKNYQLYYIHYMRYGRAENRVCK